MDPKDLAHQVKQRAAHRLNGRGVPPWERNTDQMIADLSLAVERLAEQLEKERARHVPEVH